MSQINTPTKTIEFLLVDANGDHIAYCYGKRDGTPQQVAQNISRAINCHDELVQALEAVIASGLLSGSYELPDNVRGVVMDALLKTTQP